MNVDWPEVKCWIGLLVTLPLSVVCGFELAFTVYAVPLRETFNYTQTEVEVIASAGIVGFGFSIIQPSLLQRTGVTLTYIISCVTGSAGLVLLWVSCLYRDLFKDAFMAVTIFQLLACAGMAIGAALTASISVSHFSLNSSGKIVATYAAMYALGKVFLVYLYEGAFEENDDLGGFFATIAVVFSALMLFCVVLHRPKAKNRDEEISLVSKESKEFQEKDQQTIYPLSHIVSTLKGNSMFHLTFWPAALIYSCMVTIMNNLTTIVPASHAVPSTLVTVFSVSNAFVRVCIGVVLDLPAFQTVRRKLLLKLGFSVFFVLTMAISVIWIDSDDLTIPFAIGSGASLGAMFVIPIAMVTFSFGKAFYSFIFGFFLCTAAVSVLVIQIIVGVIYDECWDGNLQNQISENCFFWPFILIIGIAVVAIVLILYNVFYQTKLQYKSSQNLEAFVTEIKPDDSFSVSKQSGNSAVDNLNGASNVSAEGDTKEAGNRNSRL